MLQLDLPMPATINPERFRLFGININNPDMGGALDHMERVITSDTKTSVAFVNADCLNKCYGDAAYHGALRDMNYIYPDGIGVRLAARMAGREVRGNINGTDMFPLLCERLLRSNKSLFLLGGRPGVAETTAQQMAERFPGLQIAGTRHGYFSAEEEVAVIDEINASGASVLLVAMGAPLQEVWMSRCRKHLEPALIMGVGGLFDFYSGRIPRAPAWLRRISMEWAWRLLQEPRRMWRRYILGNPLILYRAWRLRHRNGSVGSAVYMPPVEEERLLKHFDGLLGPMGSRVWLNRASRTLRRTWATGGRVLKRMTDICVSAMMLLLLSPLFLSVILAIRLDSPGRAFYSQKRVGFRGREFKLWKFRSMYRDAEQRRAALEKENEMNGGVLFKMKRDPRITRVGRLIRKTSIDELPQLWNVLTGDMSLVGPRPALASEVALYSIEDRVRLLSRPGLTCFWQVAGRSDIPFDQQVRLDEDYLYRQSLATDIGLLFKTIPAVISGKGAY